GPLPARLGPSRPGRRVGRRPISDRRHVRQDPAIRPEFPPLQSAPPRRILMTGSMYSRRRFLGVSALAVAGAGLTACTGVSNDSSGGGSSDSGSKTLRLFT